MNPQRLLKLLVDIEARLSRVAKSIMTIEGEFGPNADIVQDVSSLAMKLRRHQNKIDSLRLQDVGALERDVDQLRKRLADRLKTTIASNVRTILKSIHDDTPLQHFTGGLRIGLNLLEPDELIEKVPGQKLAAFQFGFSDDKIQVVDQPLRPSEEEKAIAMASLEAAIEQGEYVTLDLAASNVSPRLKDAFARLQDMMGSYSNIVQIGARTQICDRMVRAEAEELSPTLFGLLVSHIENVFSALAQFEDWREYCENASRVPLDRQSIDQLTHTMASVIAQIRLTGAAHSTVTDALETVTDWVAEPASTDKRDVFSLTRTLANLWSIAVKSSIEVGRETISEVRKAAAKAILVVLLVAGASAVPIISRVPGGEWVETVFNYLKSVGVDSAK
ncbi:hypothetical protein KYK30_11235 [Shinella yambaruensis]|uniref:Uncharacterized protein n=1 Tax=Shinella yambaruensis TaxID=415996 RepID=A0ABQ5ZCK4_9HYPH|nr:hypothetical protein [Shinella yambaruensis]MCJ8028247.1 hypothetical protein [Shinella yambaruensis]MCU7980271.1 hypothetical protein [Shinella yambaruensis]GLR49211.1 hypothetical protein GCM10007923_04160 [Shinella yambaruensis]